VNRRVSADGTGPSKDRRVFAQRLVERLREKKMTGAALARQVNISRDAVSSYTSMRSLPTEDTLAKIAKVLRCRPTDLLPKMTEDEANTVIEVREYSKPGMKLLIVRVPLPEVEAAEFYSALVKRTSPDGKRR